MLQKDALNILKFGHTTFLTGQAGSGKSYVIREYIQYLRRHDISYAVTASTGISATHVGGVTIHSWSGIGVKDTMSEYDIDHLTEKEYLYKRWNNVSVLVIDEVSMLSAQFLDNLNRLAKAMRRNESPFGGLQVIFSGDFFQLPPIGKYGEDTRFAFDSNAWKEAKPVVCYLSEQYRQAGDELTQVLIEIRKGDVTEFTYDILATRKDTSKRPDTKLYTHNVDVDRINKSAYDALSGEERIFRMKTKGSKKNIELLYGASLIQDELRLKIGTKVLCTKNDVSRRYVNGTLGEVIGFSNEGWPMIQTADAKKIIIEEDTWKLEDDGKVKAEITQVPLRYAWAITIHKSQGMTLDEAEIDLSRTFAPGMGYVALSRLRTLNGLYLSGFSHDALLLSPLVREVDQVFLQKSARAEESLKKYGEEKVRDMQETFITKCGGTLEEIEKEIVVEKSTTLEETKKFLDAGALLHEIASKRAISEDTIIGHIEKLIEGGESITILHLLPEEKTREKIMKTFVISEGRKLTPVFEALKSKHSYKDIRLVRAWMDIEKKW